MLVLKEFKLDENADEFLRITGRSEGIWAYILTLIGVDTTTELHCTGKNLLFKTASLRNGQTEINVPNSAVTAVVTGFHKPFQLLITAVVILLAGLFGLISGSGVGVFVAALVISAIFIVFYYISKATLFGVYNGGDHPLAAVYIKKSVIEGISINFEQYRKAAALLNKAVLECK